MIIWELVKNVLCACPIQKDGDSLDQGFCTAPQGDSNIQSRWEPALHSLCGEPQITTELWVPLMRPVHDSPAYRGGLHYMLLATEFWSLDNHQDFAVIRVNDIFPGLLHCYLVHKNYVLAFWTSNFANQCQVQKGYCHLSSTFSNFKGQRPTWK
jgi:hypothetical protein